ncbi:MAG: FAD-dependent oxidoreductase, partial [Clostridia bacterium]|nr:FAD-dependent oxidoreductase [Clostridia bacterium]
MFDLIIVGGGPAGLTAALYGLRAGKSVLVIEKDGFGGQMNFSPKIENYPGFASVSGSELADKMVEQILAQGAEVAVEKVTGLSQNGDGTKTVTTDAGTYTARAVILATGARHRLLGVPGERELIGDGISFCAVCDGAFYAGRSVAVIGGGNSALQEALLLAETSSHVTVLQNLDGFTGEGKLVELLMSKPNVTAVFGAAIRGFAKVGDRIEVQIEDKAGARTVTVDGVFVAIGLAPDNEAFADLVTLENGYVAAEENCKTSADGVFTAGDCRTKSVRQIATAIADGATAA